MKQVVEEVAIYYFEHERQFQWVNEILVAYFSATIKSVVKVESSCNEQWK